MKHGRLIIAALVGAMLITSLAGCGSKGTNDGESGEYQKINLSMAVNGTDTQIDSLVARHFADLVSERSGGNIVIDVFSNDTLAGGNSTKGVEYIAVGGSDLGAYATCVLANLEPKLSVATLPWSFTSYQQAREVIDTTGGEYYAEMLANKGITYLGSFHNGFRQLTNSKHAVTTPEDLKGLKIRVPGSAVYMGVFKALGASPTAMSWSEVFTAIQQGTIDGQENGCSVTKSAKMDEIQDYMTIWNYSYENDLLQETSLKALDNEEKYTPDTNFKGWIYTIMRNIFINNYRKVVRDQTFVDTTDNLYHLNLPRDAAFESTESAYDLKEMHRIVNALPREYKIPFSMHVSGFKYREIAEKLGLPLGTVKSRIYFTRQKLQQDLKDFV